MKGIYYEIGAGWTVGEFLLEQGWQTRKRRQIMTDNMIARLSHIDYFEGYFVEISPRHILQCPFPVEGN